jgi:hypothetical protein
VTASGDAPAEQDADAERSEADVAAPESGADDEATAAVPSTSADARAAEGLAPAPLPELGSFATRDELDAALVTALELELLGRGADGAPSVAAFDTSCSAAVLDRDRELLDLAYAASAQLDGAPLEVLVFWTDPSSSVNGPLRVYLIDPSTASCDAIAGGVETLVP